MQSNSSQRLKIIGQEAADMRFNKVSSGCLLKIFFSQQNKSSPAVEQIGTSIFRDICTARY